MAPEAQHHFVRGISVGGSAQSCVVELGHLYQRAAKRLDAKALRSFMLHQAEWLLHLHDHNDSTRQEYVAQTREYLRQLIALSVPARRGKRLPFRPEVLDQ